MNNTYSNALLGTKIKISGTNASSFVNSINSANIYGVTANINSSNINIIVHALGPFYLSETDTIDKPLANAGIKTGEYGLSSNITIITGNISNPTFNANSYFNIGTNWNAILNSLPQSQRGVVKEIWIAQQERQKYGTNSYRSLNVYAGTHSPAVGQPWVNDPPPNGGNL